MANKEFDPLVFLASLGAGGIAVSPFVLMQYTLDHGPDIHKNCYGSKKKRDMY